MGTNSSFIITIKKEQLSSVDDYLKRNCHLNDKQMESILNSTDKCLVLKLRVDSSIKKYVRNYYGLTRFSGDYQNANLNDRIHNDETSIGCVDLYVEEFSVKINLTFVCVTSSMSLLFADSESIRNWFVDLCKFSKAETGIFNCENEYFELVWFKDKECKLQINPEFLYDFKYYPEKMPSLTPINDLALAAFDYAYNYKR